MSEPSKPQNVFSQIIRYYRPKQKQPNKKDADSGHILLAAELLLLDTGRFGQADLGSERLADFINQVFLPWSKANKRSWKHDEFRIKFEFLDQ